MAASGAWIPRPSSFKLLQFNCQIPPEMKVSDLINKENYSWKVDFLVDKVDAIDLELIKLSPFLLLISQTLGFGTILLMGNFLLDQLMVWPYSRNERDK